MIEAVSRLTEDDERRPTWSDEVLAWQREIDEEAKKAGE
jgi:hypothetical protein